MARAPLGQFPDPPLIIIIFIQAHTRYVNILVHEQRIIIKFRIIIYTIDNFSGPVEFR